MSLVILHGALIVADPNPASVVAAERPGNDLGKSAVIHLAHKNTHGVVIMDPGSLIQRVVKVMRHNEAADFHGAGSGNFHHGTDGVGAIVSRRQPQAPVIGRGRKIGIGPDGKGMHVFRFGINKFTQLAGILDPLHFQTFCIIGIIFRKGIDQPALFHGFHQIQRFPHGETRHTFADHVFARPQRLDCRRRVFRGIIGKDHGIHVVFQKFTVIAVQCQFGVFFHDLFRTIGHAVADCHRLKASPDRHTQKITAASAGTIQTDPDLAFFTHTRIPCFCFVFLS